jgi:hypothetical protein
MPTGVFEEGKSVVRLVRYSLDVRGVGLALGPPRPSICCLGFRAPVPHMQGLCGGLTGCKRALSLSVSLLSLSFFLSFSLSITRARFLSVSRARTSSLSLSLFGIWTSGIPDFPRKNAFWQPLSEL